jgi:hypothetical protein
MLLTPKTARPRWSRLRAALRPERLPALVEPARHAAQRLGHRPPDVVLDVPTLRVDEIELQFDDLKARVALEAHVLDLLRLDVGVAAELRGVSLQIKGVAAQPLAFRNSRSQQAGARQDRHPPEPRRRSGRRAAERLDRMTWTSGRAISMSAQSIINGTTRPFERGAAARALRRRAEAQGGVV